MSVHPLRPSGEPDDLDGFNNLFDDVKRASSHELELAAATFRRPKLPFRSVHPVTRAAIPDIDDKAYAELRDDIARNGQRRAVVMYQGMIFDGRGRYDACIELGLVPRVRILRSRDPLIWLLDQNIRRMGEPNSPERIERVKPLQRLRDQEWKEEAARLQAEWIADARLRFQQDVRPRLYARPCAVCALGREYSHAHHLLPLNVQYDIGIDEALQDIEWLCPVHHRDVHRILSIEVYGGRERDVALGITPYHAAKAVAARGIELFRSAGGVTTRGNWGMF